MTQDIPQTEKQRSRKQQACIQIYARNLADKLNEAGISQQLLLSHFDIDWSEESLKAIFRQIGKQKYGKNSTADLSTIQCNEIYDEMNRRTSLEGVSEPWPSEEEIRYKAMGAKRVK